MTKKQTIIVGCGDVGFRIAKRLDENSLIAIVSSKSSCQQLVDKQMNAHALNFDDVPVNLEGLNLSTQAVELYYLVPPQLSGEDDQRSRAFLQALTEQVMQHEIMSLRIVLISTTGVYGDHDGEWVTESTLAEPQTERAKRRLSLEQQWREFVGNTGSDKAVMSILRVPGIYSHSRLPRERLEKQIPLVHPDECGYTNRIHADDLATICIEVMRQQTQTDVYNVSDGTPGKISEYLLEAAKVLEIKTPPLITMAEADTVVSAGMLSYLRESRKISNQKLLETFEIELLYPDFRKGILC